jgi:hypothetical protein
LMCGIIFFFLKIENIAMLIKLSIEYQSVLIVEVLGASIDKYNIAPIVLL